MIGKICISILPYYDKFSKSQKFKSRPCLVIGQADISDYVILPISSVTDKSKIDPIYDVFLDKTIYTFLSKDSYLRTHKQTIVNISLIRDELSDFKSSYEEIYQQVLVLVEQFQKNLITNAL